MIEQFLDYLRYERNRSELTVKRYGESLTDFQKYFEKLEDGLTWASVDADVIRMWIESRVKKGNVASTANTDLSALKYFVKTAFAISRLTSISSTNKTRLPLKSVDANSF